MNKTNEVNLELILDELGHFGTYQLRVYIYVLIVIIFSALSNSQYIFAAGDLRYRCEVPECEKDSSQYDTGDWGKWALPKTGGLCERLVPLDDKCTPDSFHKTQTQKCSSWVYDGDSTIVAEFNLACQDWKRTLVGTIHNVGVFFALGITALVSDTFGRKIAFIGTAVASGIVGVIRAFSVSYIMYIMLEFIEATIGAGVYSAGYILAVEMVDLNHRVLGGNMISITFALGQVITALLAMTFPYWRTLTLVIYAPALFFLLYYFVIEESVRWLLSKGMKQEAIRIIFKAAAVNNVKLSPATIKMLTEEPEELNLPFSSTHESVRNVNEPRKLSIFKEVEVELNEPSLFIQILKSKTLVSRVFICSFWWITITFIYYGLSINSVSLAGNMYMNYILSSLVEIPGYTISYITLDRFGRKSSIITAFFICGIALISLPFISTSSLVNALSMLGKLTISMVFTSIYIYTIELFPTYARHSCMSCCSMVGRFGSMAAPQTPLLMSYMESLPYLIFGIMAACSGLLMLLTPETLRIQLPDTILQAENIIAAPRTTRRTDIIVD